MVWNEWFTKTKFCDLEVTKSSFCGSRTNQTGENAETTSGRKDFLRDPWKYQGNHDNNTNGKIYNRKRKRKRHFKALQHYSQYGPLTPGQSQG